MKLTFFNTNNLFLRYQFGRTFPGDISRKSTVANPRWGFLPEYRQGMFVPYRPEQVALCAEAMQGDGALPDLLCLCEVESLLALRVFNEENLSHHYPYALLIDSYDFRQIDVAVLSRKEILSVRTHVDDLGADGKRIFSRDCLEVTIALNKSGSSTFTVFVNHLKSKFVDTRGKKPAQIQSEEQAATERRRQQALAVRSILRERFPGERYGEARFAVVGDFNAAPAEPSVAPLLKSAGLHNVVADLAPGERWTYWWKAKNHASQIDYLLLSPALADEVARRTLTPHIERRGLPFRSTLADGLPGPKETSIFEDESAGATAKAPFQFRRFSSVTERLGASDHCPVSLELPL
jgi:endonuclease/exonuclease/phosphatase family metal-dependent hydrolase